MITQLCIKRLLTADDVNRIYDVFSDPKEQFRIWPTANFNSREKFCRMFINQDIIKHNDFFLIEAILGEFIGFIMTYDYSPNAAHIKMMQYVQEKYRSLGAAYVSGIKLVEWVFNRYAVNKIFTDIYGYNQRSIDYNIKIGFKEEGTIPGYRYYCGEYWPLHIYSLKREIFFERNNNALQRFQSIQMYI